MEQIKIRVKKIQNYITGKNLGRGTFGDVRLATHTISGERVAMKILEKDKIYCQDDFKRVLSEIQVLKLLSHSHIVKLLEVIETSRHIYIITEFLPNGELFNYVVSNKRLQEAQARRFFYQIVSALHYAHSRNVVHRDLKLENILLDADFNVKIIDFGLSSILKNQENLETACGSPSYAAPEMLTGGRFDGFAADVWAAGILLYAMLCGCLPFDDEQIDRLYRKIVKGAFKMPEWLSDDAKDIIQRILQINPAERLKVDQIMRHPFFTKDLDPNLINPSYVRPQTLDFRVVYAMIQAIPGWSAVKIIKALNYAKHNNMTATYFLLNERRAKQSNYRWEFSEQTKYAHALGFSLHENGDIDVLEEVEGEADTGDLRADDSVLDAVQNMSESESMSGLLD